ncbi:hypothetical protein QVD17_27753 [Tagetes erecta]|uniref:Uncharacterized protein n=1 Tax=Tagetes erecta TaxID=13708 RepID=A0AAD8NRW7_TARER|nr:hypothetical protein QVD17_27753 [Tagetes erecta]
MFFVYSNYDEETSPREEVNNFEEFFKLKEQNWDQHRKEIRELHAAVLKDDCETIEAVLSKHCYDLTDSITIHGNTLIHLVVGSGKCKHLTRILNNVPSDIPLDAIRNSEGSTLLHVAAIVGNTEAAKLLVERCHSLLNAKDNKGQTPLNIALSNMHTETCLFLMEQCRKDENYLFHEINYEGLINLISSKDYQLALRLVVSDVHRFLSHAESVLMAIAQNFPPEPNFWERNLIKYFTCSDCDFVKAAETKYNAYINAKEFPLVKDLVSSTYGRVPERYSANKADQGGHKKFLSSDACLTVLNTLSLC